MLEHIKPPDEMDISYEWSKEVDLDVSLFNTWIQGNLSYPIARNILWVLRLRKKKKRNACHGRYLFKYQKWYWAMIRYGILLPVSTKKDNPEIDPWQ